MTASRRPLRVVKVGGSLLDWPPLPVALREWLVEQPPALNVLVCGGGALTDAIRQADRTFGLGETAAHWLCIDALSVSARLLAALIGDIPVVDEPVPALALQASIIFDPRRFLIEIEPQLPGLALPHNWNATTDSIAARIAEALAADELVLLKSADLPASANVLELAATGYVDGHFPSAAAALARVRYLNFRRSSSAPTLREIVCSPHAACARSGRP